MKLFFTLICLLVTTSCTSQVYNMGLIIPEHTNFNLADIDHATVRRNISSEDSRGIILFIPLGYPNFETTIQQALKAGQGDIIINARVQSGTNWFVIGGKNYFKITGDVIKLPQSNPEKKYE